MKLLNNLIFLIASLLVLLFSNISNATQYILSFTDYNSFLMIDIGTGDLVFNLTMTRYYNVDYVMSVDYDTTTISFLVDYATGGGSAYALVDYNWESNTFSNKSKAISLYHVDFTYFEQPFQMVDNQFMIPAYGYYNYTIAYLDYNNYKYEFVTYNLTNFNSTYPAVGAYSSITNKYYSLYYTTEDNTPMILSVDVPYVQGGNGNSQDQKIYQFPNQGEDGSIPICSGAGTLFVAQPTGQLYYVGRNPTNNSVYEINLTTLQAKLVYVEPIDYNNFFSEHFESFDNQYLIFMNGPTDTNPTVPVTYKFVDTTSWKTVYTFNSTNYFDTLADMNDDMFYFNGKF